VTDERLEHEDEVIGRALHALDEIDLDLSDDAEVLEYYEVLACMPVEEIAPPTALEARVLDAARAARPPESRSLAARRRKTRRIVAVGAAAAIAAVVGLAVVAGTDASSPGRELTGDFVRAVDPAEVRALLDTPDATTFGLDAEAGQIGRVVVADGNGALYDTALAERDDVTYWFWVTGPTGDVPVAPVDAGTGRGLLFAVEGEMTGALISAETGRGVPAAPTTVVGEGTFG
jgi:hypothetical protein